MTGTGGISQADFQAINAGLGKAIASVPTATVMDVYNEMAKLVGSSPVPNFLFSKVNPQDAIAAYNGLLEFKDVVKAAQREASIMHRRELQRTRGSSFEASPAVTC